MITNGFTYIALLAFIAGGLIWAQHTTKAKFFDYVPPVVLLYLIGMICCTFSVWDTAETKAAYNAVRNPILYAMIFLMLLLGILGGAILIIIGLEIFITSWF